METKNETAIIEHEGNAKQGIMEYGVTNARLAELKESYTNMPATTPAEYKALVKGIGEVRTLRTSINKKRLQFKRDLDSEAARITSALVALENPMKATKAEWDDKKAKEKAEKERLEKIRVDGITDLITNRFGLQRINKLQTESATLIRCRIAAIEAVSISDDEYAEFVPDATKAKQIIVEAANVILVNRIQFEIEEKERKEKEAKLEEERKTLEDEKARLAEIDAKQKAEQVRILAEKEALEEQQSIECVEEQQKEEQKTEVEAVGEPKPDNEAQSQQVSKEPAEIEPRAEIEQNNDAVEDDNVKAETKQDSVNSADQQETKPKPNYRVTNRAKKESTVYVILTLSQLINHLESAVSCADDSDSCVLHLTAEQASDLLPGLIESESLARECINAMDRTE